MKKLMSLLLAAVMLLSFAACSNNGGKTAEATQEPTEAPTAEPTEEVNTKGTRSNPYMLNEPITFTTIIKSNLSYVADMDVTITVLELISQEDYLAIGKSHNCIFSNYKPSAIKFDLHIDSDYDDAIGILAGCGFHFDYITSEMLNYGVGVSQYIDVNSFKGVTSLFSGVDYSFYSEFDGLDSNDIEYVQINYYIPNSNSDTIWIKVR